MKKKKNNKSNKKSSRIMTKLNMSGDGKERKIQNITNKKNTENVSQ